LLDLAANQLKWQRHVTKSSISVLFNRGSAES